MPMPDLNPARYVPAVLSDTTHKLPMPDKGGRLFSRDPASPEVVDIFDPYYASLLADGSIRRACPVALAQAKAVADAKASAGSETPADKPAETPAETPTGITPPAAPAA